MPIGILAGTGLEGSGLALRLGQAGFPVVVGSRLANRAIEKAKQLTGDLAKAGFPTVISGAANSELASNSDLMLLTAPFEHAADLLKSCQSTMTPGSVLVDATVPLVFQAGRVELRELKVGSGSEYLRQFLPESCELVAAFKTIPAHVLVDIDRPLDCDLFVCSDSQQAKSRVIEIASRIPGLRPLDAGSLRQAQTLERMTALAVEINRRYKVKSARFRVIGV